MAHVKVALTSNNLTEVDADFASAKQILIYDVSDQGSTFVDAVQFDGRPAGQRGPGGGVGCAGLDPLDGSSAEIMEARYASLRGCGILFTRRMNDFASVRVHEGATFPVKMERKRDVAQVLDQVQQLIRTRPPRWLAKRLLPSGEATAAPTP